MSFKQLSHQNIFESLKNQKNSVSIDARAFENLGFSGIFKAFSLTNKSVVISSQEQR